MNIIETRELGIRAGGREILRGVTMSVPHGCRLALFGGEGTGKSALLQTLLNLLPVHSGAAQVLGMDVRRLGGPVFGRIGYVPQHTLIPAHWTVRQFLERWRPFYAAWDRELEDELLMWLSLPLDVRVRGLERNARLKAAVLGSTLFRPELLVLDGTFDGMDVKVRGEIMHALEKTAAPDGTTLVAAVRDVVDVEGICDTVAWIDAGQVRLIEKAASLCARFRRIEVTFVEAPERVDEIPGHWMSIVRRGRRLHAFDYQFGDGSDLRAWNELWPGAVVHAHVMTLREVCQALMDSHDSGRDKAHIAA